MVLAPGAAGVADQEPGQPGLPEPNERMGVAIAGQQHQRRLAVVRAQHLIPSRAEQLQQRVEALQDRGAALHDRGPLLDQTAQWIGRPVPGELAQPVGMQQRQPGQQC
jgi:hypothetical protein